MTCIAAIVFIHQGVIYIATLFLFTNVAEPLDNTDADVGMRVQECRRRDRLQVEEAERRGSHIRVREGLLTQVLLPPPLGHGG